MSTRFQRYDAALSEVKGFHEGGAGYWMVVRNVACRGLEAGHSVTDIFDSIKRRTRPRNQVTLDAVHREILYIYNKKTALPSFTSFMRGQHESK